MCYLVCSVLEKEISWWREQARSVMSEASRAHTPAAPTPHADRQVHTHTKACTLLARKYSHTYARNRDAPCWKRTRARMVLLCVVQGRYNHLLLRTYIEYNNPYLHYHNLCLSISCYLWRVWYLVTLCVGY